MAKDVFVGIVPTEGSNQADWIGVFSFDHVAGYTGQLLSKMELKPGPIGFDIPSGINKDILFCILDGSEFATIVWPRHSGLRINNFVSQIVRTRIMTLVRGAHIGEKDICVLHVTLYSPLFALLFDRVGYTQQMEMNPLRVTVESKSEREIEFATSIGHCFIGVQQIFNPPVGALTVVMDATGYLRVELREAKPIIEAIKLIQRLEQLLSLLCFNYVKCKSSQIKVRFSNRGTGGQTDRELSVERAHLIPNPKLELDWHEMPLRLNSVNLGEVLGHFLDIFDGIEQSLHWYRIVQTEDRYLADRYFYCVRMIESLYRKFEIATERDMEAIEKARRICGKLDSVEDRDLTEFISTRVLPMFTRPWSLSDIMRDLKKRYAEMVITGILDERFVTKLRGKEAHGTSESFSLREYKFMAYSIEIFVTLYTLVILERCGLGRDYLLSSLKRLPSRANDFSRERLEVVQADIGTEDA
jgi:hypothetical protein